MIWGNKLLNAASIVRSLCCLLFGLMVTPAVADQRADQAFLADQPTLQNLFDRYRAYETSLRKYAQGQGFRGPVEQIATILHEMIHIDSAVHQGYFIDGIYYEPYLNPQNWPTLRNSDIAMYLGPNDRSIISNVYVPSTPKNGLGNAIDELNAYSHVIARVCKLEPSSAGKQTGNTIGFLKLIEVYFRVLRANKPDEYTALAKNRLSAGAIETISQRASKALSDCGLPEAEYRFPETDYFIQWSRTQRK